MNKENIKQTIAMNHAILTKEFGAKEIALFGSFVSNRANKESDIDLLVTLEDVSYKKFIRLQIFLEQLLNHKVDLVRKGPHLSSGFLTNTHYEIIYA